MSPWCATLTNCGMNSNKQSVDSFSTSPASPKSGRPIAARLRPSPRLAPRAACSAGIDAPLPCLQGAAGLCRRPPTGWRSSRSRARDCSAARTRDGRRAKIRTGEVVRAVEPRAGGVRIFTDRGSVEAGAAIVAAGAWVRSLLPELAAPLRVTREAMGWFEPTDAQLFSGGCTPVFIIESRHGMHYGIPPQGSVHAGVKVAKHHHRNETVDPDAYDRTVSAADEALIRAAIAEHIPAANGRL